MFDEISLRPPLVATVLVTISQRRAQPQLRRCHTIAVAHDNAIGRERLIRGPR
jgi:hypothetical protein